MVRDRTFAGTIEGTTRIATAFRAHHAVASTHRWKRPDALARSIATEGCYAIGTVEHTNCPFPSPPVWFVRAVRSGLWTAFLVKSSC